MEYFTVKCRAKAIEHVKHICNFSNALFRQQNNAAVKLHTKIIKKSCTRHKDVDVKTFYDRKKKIENNIIAGEIEHSVKVSSAI